MQFEVFFYCFSDLRRISRLIPFPIFYYLKKRRRHQEQNGLQIGKWSTFQKESSKSVLLTFFKNKIPWMQGSKIAAQVSR